MRKVNRQTRKKDKATGILTFLAGDFVYPPGEEVYGEILFSVEAARKEARTMKISEKEWLKRLLVHSFLHLLGFQHQNDKDAEIMEKKEDEILTKLEKL